MRAVAYYRYSTENRQQRDNSEARQKDAVEHLIIRKGWLEVDSFVDKSTSGADDKPQLISLQERIETQDIEFDVLVIDNLNRITRRNVIEMHKDVGWLHDNNIKLSIVDRNDGHPMTIEDLARDISLVVTQHQNHEKVQETSQKVSDGMRVKFQRGDLGWMGKAPYGYKIQKHIDKPSSLIPDEDFHIIGDMLKDFIKNKSVRGCVTFLNKTKRFVDNPDKIPTATSVKNILRNSIYCGIRTIGVRGVGKYNTIRGDVKKHLGQSPLVQAAHYIEYNPEGFQPAISIARFKKIQEILDKNTNVFRKRPSRRKHRYSGLMRCGTCGDSMSAATYHSSKSKDEKIIKYVCPSSQNTTTKKCLCDDSPHSKSVREDEFEPLLIDAFTKLFFTTDTHKTNIIRVLKELEDEGKTAIVNVDNDLELQKERLNKIKEVYLDVGGEELKKNFREQALIVRQLEDETDDTDRDLIDATVLDIARQQWKDSKGLEGIKRYLGLCYREAARISKSTNKKKINIELKKSADRIKEEILSDYLSPEAVQKDLEVMGIPYKPVSSKQAKGKSAFIGKSDELIGLLMDMGLDHILANFERVLWRGKSRNVATSLDFIFSVTPNNLRDTGAVFISYQTLCIST